MSKLNLRLLTLGVIAIFSLNKCNKENINPEKEQEADIIYGIKYGENYGYINSDGEILIDSLDESYLGEVVGEKQFVESYDVWIDSSGFIPHPVYDLVWKCYYKDGSVDDITGGYISIKFEYDEIPAYTFLDGLAIVCNQEELFGFVDENINEVVPCNYLYVSRFSEGLAAVVDAQNQKLGFIDKTGNYVIQPQYKPQFSQQLFNDGMAIVETDSSILLIDKSNNIITDFSDLMNQGFYPTTKSISEDLIAVSKREDNKILYGFINTSGEIKIEPNFLAVCDFHDGIAMAKKETNYPAGKYIYIDKTGNQVFSGEYDIAYEFEEHELALIGIHGNSSIGTCYFINKSGEKAFPLEFSYASTNQGLLTYYFNFVNGYALIAQNGGWQYINTTGETILVCPKSLKTTPHYGYVYGFGSFNQDGIAKLIFEDGTWGYINKSGDMIWESTESLYKEDNLY